MNRLVGRQLVEVNTRSLETVKDATHIRVTSAGWYYIRYLIHSFGYLDLVFQDTPINSEAVVTSLAHSLMTVNNLAGKENQKEQRLDERFSRVLEFLYYLHQEEQDEIRRFNLQPDGQQDFPLIMDNIVTSFKEQRGYIINRIKENNEAYWFERPDANPEEFLDNLAP